MSNTDLFSRFGRTAAFMAVCLSSTVAHALPDVGASLPVAHLVDSNDNRFELQSARGRPILVVYEDKDSAHVNDAFKAELSRLARSGKYKSSVTLVPVADVRRYDQWPIRGFVKDAVRDESRKQGTSIYCDWSGEFSRALSLQTGTSSIVLFGRNGRVLFSKAGQLTAGEIQQVIALLRAEVEGRPS